MRGTEYWEKWLRLGDILMEMWKPSETEGPWVSLAETFRIAGYRA